MNRSKVLFSAVSAWALMLSVGTAAASGQCSYSKQAKAECEGDKVAQKQSDVEVVNASYVTEMAASDIIDTAMGNPDFSTLVTAIKEAGLVETLKGKGPFTVFAPTNAAFAKVDKDALAALLKNKPMLTGVLTYHVVAGDVKAADVTKLTGATTVNGQRADIKVEKGTVMIDGAKVTKTDIVCSNGVIHVIDAVLMPTSTNLIETAVAAGTFKTLAAALDAAGLVSTLSNDGPFTVFAPTDAAFKALPAGTVENLLKPENKQQLTDVLTYHVVKGRVYSPDALKLGKAPTLQGGTIEIAAKDGKATVNGINIAKTDIDASNGVIHVIDGVLMPKGK